MADTDPGKIRQSIEVETDADQAYFWTDKWQAGEREATHEHEAGQGGMCLTGDELLRSLDPERAERDVI